MAKLHLPKLNSWVTTLVLASIGLHGLVLALPMPNLVVEETPEIPEIPDPEVIQVVTLPKLAKAPESSEPPLPEPPAPLPDEPVEQSAALPVEDIVLTEPEIIDEIEPELDEFIEDEWHEEPDIGPDPVSVDEDWEEEEPIELTLDQRLASSDSYGDANYNSDHTGTKGEELANSQLIAWSSGASDYEIDWTPDHLTIPDLEIPLQECFQGREPNPVVGVGVLTSPDGSLTSEPELLGGTGYSVLDEKALEIARNVIYPSTGEKQAYSIQIRVNYTKCL